MPDPAANIGPSENDNTLFYTIQLNRNGVVKFQFMVDAKEAAAFGDWHNGKPYQPDRVQVREALPSAYRKAFDRAMVWWQEESMSGRMMPLKCDLKNVHGEPMGTLYATPRWNLIH